MWKREIPQLLTYVFFVILFLRYSYEISILRISIANCLVLSREHRGFLSADSPHSPRAEGFSVNPSLLCQAGIFLTQTNFNALILKKKINNIVTPRQENHC